MSAVGEAKVLASLTIGGLRGIANEITLDFAKPDGNAGSGLTALVGTNNSGKSTIIEALKLMTQLNPPSIAQGMRNGGYGDQIMIRAESADGSVAEIASIRPGSSSTERRAGGAVTNLLVVPSRRTFPSQFGGGKGSRSDYASTQTQTTELRYPILNSFSRRLFDLETDEASRRMFDDLISQVVGYAPDWALDLNESAQHFLKFRWTTTAGAAGHSSDGLGDGLISLFVIVDALRDMDEEATLVIDEPELSLHPQYQRRLRTLLSKYGEHRQIVYATHSPYFVDWSDIAAGSRVVRVFKTHSGTQIASPSPASLRAVLNIGSKNLHNPHVLGLNANEVFFLEDGVVLTEGQEDVVLLPHVLNDLDVDLRASFFGWGVGGAENMPVVAQLLSELEYPRVAGVLDSDKQDLAESLGRSFPKYRFRCIPAEDIRDKPERGPTQAKLGLLDHDCVVKSEFRDSTRLLLEEVRDYFDQVDQKEIV